MELDIINKLYLELSQVATATTANELSLERHVETLSALAKPILTPEEIRQVFGMRTPSESVTLTPGQVYRIAQLLQNRRTV